MSNDTVASGLRTTETQHTRIHERMLSPDVSGEAFKLYCLLTTYSDGSGYVESIARSVLAERMGRSTRTVTTYLRELEALRAVEVVPQYDGRERMGNAYRLLAGDRA